MTRRKADQTHAAGDARSLAYPFAAIVGQDELKLALLLNAVEPRVGGVLAWGHRGTGKSTAVRALAELLPPLARVAGCPFNCDPSDADSLCARCRAQFEATGRLRGERALVPVVELPLNATEDRVCGTLDLAGALADGALRFAPGLLARAHRGFLYIDEVNLLEDHLVDLLLDAAASGRNRVEREGVAAEHAARFALVGSANPEEGELRPQLLDRFGLCADVRTSTGADERAEIVTRREAFDRDPSAFRAAAEDEQTRLRKRLARARRTAASVRVPHALVRRVAELCVRLGVEGHRGELTITRAARALAALEGRREATGGDVRRVAALALRHRLRQDPLGTTDGGALVEQLAEELFGGAEEATKQTRGGGGTNDTNGRGARPNERSAKPDGRSREPDDRSGKLDGRGGKSDARSVNASARGAESNGRHAQSGGRDAETDARSAESSARDEGTGGRGGEANARGAANAPAPAEDGSASFESFEASLRGGRKVSRFSSAGRGAGRRREDDARRGRYVRATERATEASSRLAFDATARAAASRLAAASAGGESASSRAVAGRVVAEDLRFKRLSRKAGTLYILAVDASGSMAANRIRQAKGALSRLLVKSYVERDRVAVVSFRGRAAELLLRPSASAALAKRRLDALPVGGPTPLASALLRSLEVARRATLQGARRVRLLVFTDGRANVTLDGASRPASARLDGQVLAEIERLGAALARAGVSTVVVDTRARFDATHARAVAAALGAHYTRLETPAPR